MMPHQQQDMRSVDQQPIGNFEAPTPTPDDYYIEQMLSSLPSWNEFTTHTKSAWDLKQQQQQQAVQFDDESAIIMHQMNGNNSGLERSIQGLYNGFAESLQSQQFIPSQMGVDPLSAQGNNGSAPRQRVRARRGQATDPHSIAERLRRERIAERMKGLQELVPNINKTDKASMLDEIIDYVKFLQLQVKVLSVSRMGGAAAVAPLVVEAEVLSRAKMWETALLLSSYPKQRRNATGIGSGATSTDEDASLTLTEQQVAKLMEEDMGSAMQYLQAKGLCLMPISLATAISHSHSHSLPIPHNNKNIGNVNGPTSPTASVLTVQSSAFINDSTSALG